jgi:hypothetical protein
MIVAAELPQPATLGIHLAESSMTATGQDMAIHNLRMPLQPVKLT